VASPVNKRPYTSPARQARADATRARILDAATTLFLEHGYARTSTAAIGKAAGVSEASVFATWRTKADLLVAVVSNSVGNHPDFPLRTNPRWQKVAGSNDTTSAVTEFGRVTRRAHERSWRLLAIAYSAGQEDPTVAAAVATAAQRRHDDCAWFVTHVIGLDPHTAARKIDAVWALVSVENYRRLVIERHWPAHAYEAWLTELLRHQLA
jgi:AcrR family transcriptional regulator